MLVGDKHYSLLDQQLVTYEKNEVLWIRTQALHWNIR